MIDYNLAKQLKEKGFPNWHIDSCECERCSCYYIPTLDELIEACGLRFGELQRDIDDIGEVIWYAAERSYKGVYGKGKTPEEAVAKLWIELNKKVVNKLK